MIKRDPNKIPKSVEVFGRIIKTKIDNEGLMQTKNYGEARYGANEIAISTMMPSGRPISPEEIKITYLHELMHFILYYTMFQQDIENGIKIDLEQFVELMAAALYQVEKTAKY